MEPGRFHPIRKRSSVARPRRPPNSRELALKLYYMPGACSLGIHVLLEEIGKPYDLQKIDGAKQEQYGPGFAKLNSKSNVPWQVRDAGAVLTVFSAIAT